MKEQGFGAVEIQRFGKQLLHEEKSRLTVEKYLRDVGRFCCFVKDKALTKELILSYKQWLQEQQYTPNSINSMLTGVNKFLEYLGRSDCKVRLLRTQRRLFLSAKQELTKAEYLRLLNAAGNNTQTSLILQTICATGIRVSELRYFTVEAFHQGEIRVRCKNKTRVILLPAKLCRLLLRYAKQNGIRRGAIFVTRTGKPLDRSCIWLRMKRLCTTANVEPSKVFPHNLRKLFARTFYNSEKDIAKLADLLGHSSIETTRIYIKSTDVEHRKKIEKLGLLITAEPPEPKKAAKKRGSIIKVVG